MKTFKMYMGIPGCGKSTQARKIKEELGDDCVIVNRDTIREELGCWGAENWSPESEKEVLRERNARIQDAMTAGIAVIISDDTNYSPKNRNIFEYFCKKFGYTFEVIDLSDVPLAVCIERDSKREGFARVGELVIRKIAKQSGRYDKQL
jgi:predicted kinase